MNSGIDFISEMEINVIIAGQKKMILSRYGGKFYGGRTRGKKLEVDRRDNEKGYTLENCVLACSICNNAKSDKFTGEEFKKVGKSIEQIWSSRDKKS